MSLFYLKKFFEGFPSAAAPANGLASSHATQRLQFSTNSLSHLQQPVCPWSAHAPPSEQSLSPLLRDSHTLSTSATTGELILFGGDLRKSDCQSNDLYVISTRDFSKTLLRTSGDVPDPRHGHCAVLTSTTLLIWGGTTIFCDYNDSLFLLNLGMSDLFDVTTHFN